MNKGKERKKREGKQKKGVGIGVKIVALLLLLAVAALSCMGVLVQTLQSVIVTNDEIVAGQVAEQEKISELSRQFTYINGQVLTHVMTTNSVTMENLSDKILQEITDMEQQMTEFEGLLSEGDARREAFDSASAELAKYKKTVESLLVTSAENKTQAYVSATSNLPMFNEHIESYMNQMLEITGEQMAQAQGQMEQSAARVPMIVAVASLVLLAVVVVIMLGLRIWVIGPVKYATRQVDELVEGIRNNRGDITRRIRVKSGDEVGRLSMAINDLVAQMQTIIRAITESCGHMEEKQTGIISNVEKVNATAEDTTQKLGVMAGGMQSVTEAIGGVQQDTGVLDTTVENMLEVAQDGRNYAADIKDRAGKMKATAVASKQEATQVMKEIDTAMTESIANSRQIHKITELTEEILGIAGTTNLLALNASIEAARAGEAGKGFAVVADQIRSLSEQSAKAAVDTRELIEGAIEVTNEGNEAAERVSVSIEKVISGMKSVAASSQELSEIADEQAKAMEQAEQGINQISEVVQSNSANAEETSATSEELSAQAVTMNDLISKFSLEK